MSTTTTTIAHSDTTAVVAPDGHERDGAPRQRRRRARRALLGLLSLAVLFTLVPLGASAASAAGENLKNVTVSPTGMSATATVSLQSAKGAWMEIGAKPVPINNPYYLGASAADFVDAAFSWSPKLTHSLKTTKLEQDKQYWMQLHYQQADGTWTTKVNINVHTLKRYVQTQLLSATVLDDSDPGGCGELRFRWRVKSASSTYFDRFTPWADICDNNYTKNQELLLQNYLGHVPDSVGSELSATIGAEDDDDSGLGFNTCGTLAFGCLGEHASIDVKLPIGMVNGQEGGSRTFNHEVNADSVHVKFTGSVLVYYK